MRTYLLPKEGHFYKANLHSHTTISDGRMTPEELKELYKSHGYSVLAYTDHDIFLPHNDLTDETFLALNGFEAEFFVKRGDPSKKTCHICFVAKSPDMELQPCWNEKDAIIGNAGSYACKVKHDESEQPFERVYGPEKINEMMKRAREKNFFVTYNHPTWSQENYEQYSKYENMHAMEIFNNDCQVLGYQSYVPGIYEDMLRLGKKIFVTATDDNHNKHPMGDPKFDSFGGFTMIKADSLDYESVTDALFAGNFYASQGPEIYDLYVEDGKIHVTCSDAVMILLNTTHRSAQSVYTTPDKPVNEAVFEYHESDVYLRITVKDAQGRFADTNAYYIADFDKE